MSVSKEFVLAGDAIFTVEEPDSKHHTWRIEHVEADDRWPESWFAKLLTGPNNTRDYTYVGKLDPFTGQVATTAKSHRFDDSRALRLLNRVLARIWCDDHAAYEQHGFKVHHEGRCGRCGRTLTTPESCERGIGPECWKLMGMDEKSAEPEAVPAPVKPRGPYAVSWERCKALGAVPSC